MAFKEAGVNRRDIEAKLANVGDYVKIDYLTACLKHNLDFDTKKFVFLKLATLYEERKMFQEAGRVIRNAAEINTTYEGKMSDFMRGMELFIKGGAIDEAEASFAKALACADGIQKERLKNRRKEAYKKQAAEYISKDKRKHAMDIYEKYISLPDTSIEEKKEAQNALLPLYEKLGKVREYGALKRSMSLPLGAPAEQAPVREREQRDEGSRQQSFSFREIGLDD